MKHWKMVWPIGVVVVLSLAAVDFATVGKSREVKESSCCLEGGHADHGDCPMHETSVMELPPGHPDISDPSRMPAPVECPYLKENPSKEKIMTQTDLSQDPVLTADVQRE